MTAPNIVNVTTINGKSAVADLGTTLTTTLLTAASDQVNKINLIRVTNVTDNDATTTIDSDKNNRLINTNHLNVWKHYEKLLQPAIKIIKSNNKHSHIIS